MAVEINNFENSFFFFTFSLLSIERLKFERENMYFDIFSNFIFREEMKQNEISFLYFLV